MSENLGHNNEPPQKEEALQYITYSAKELLYILNGKVDQLDQKIDAMQIQQAALDARYVTQIQYKESQKEAAGAKRFAIASVISSVGALGTIIGIWISTL